MVEKSLTATERKFIEALERLSREKGQYMIFLPDLADALGQTCNAVVITAYALQLKGLVECAPHEGPISFIMRTPPG